METLLAMASALEIRLDGYDVLAILGCLFWLGVLCVAYLVRFATLAYRGHRYTVACGGDESAVRVLKAIEADETIRRLESEKQPRRRMRGGFPTARSLRVVK